MTMHIQFPPNFWWGGATSGPQSEGAFDKPHDSVMDFWFKESPNEFFDQVGPEIASDFYHRYEEDFDLMQKVGFNSFRTSIQWSRLIKDLETGEPDEKAVDFYNRVIESAKEHDIALVMNLHHFDMPIELLQKYGGWESRHVVDLFVKFCRTAFELFGDKVRYWTTFNEPMVIPEAGYLDGFHYPKYAGKGKEAVQVIYNINLASALAIQAFKEMHVPGEIGIILNLTPSYPRSDSKEDLAAAHFADLMYNRSFLDPAVKGHLPEELVAIWKQDGVMPEGEAGDDKVLADNTIDFLGVNYYHPKRVQAPLGEWPADKPWMPTKYFAEYEWPEMRINPYRGWEIYPQALYDIAINVRDNYNNIPWFVSENGMGVEGEEKFRGADGEIADEYRINFYKEHLYWLNKGMQEGSMCFGYHTWAAMDCWSWNNAYKNRYGFISIHLPDQTRSIKHSGYWYKKLSETNSYDFNPETDRVDDMEA